MSYQYRIKLTDRQKEAVVKKFYGNCNRCGLNATSHWEMSPPYRRKVFTFFLGNMEIHHINKFSCGGGKNIENTELLCVACHKKEHSNCRDQG